MTKINELNSGQGNVEVEGVIKEFGEPRSFNKFGRELTVVNAILEDDSGSIKLSLWNEDATRFKAGDKVKIINGYVNEFQGEPQLTSGKFGNIEKLDAGSEETAGSEGTESESESSEETGSSESESSEKSDIAEEVPAEESTSEEPIEEEVI